MELIILLDVDNTLLDNDAVKRDLEEALRTSLGEEDVERFWGLYEQVRDELGMVSFPDTVERFLPSHCADPLAPQNAARAIFELNFARRLRPGAVELLTWAGTSGIPVILSNGDQFFQRWKIWKSGLAEASENRVWVFPEKEHHLEDLDDRFGPGAHYVLVEDKLRALRAARRHWGDRVTTVLMDFGHHAPDERDPEGVDLVVGSPAELLSRRGELPRGGTGR